MGAKKSEGYVLQLHYKLRWVANNLYLYRSQHQHTQSCTDGRENQFKLLHCMWFLGLDTSVLGRFARLLEEESRTLEWLRGQGSCRVGLRAAECSEAGQAFNLAYSELSFAQYWSQCGDHPWKFKFDLSAVLPQFQLNLHSRHHGNHTTLPNAWHTTAWDCKRIRNSHTPAQPPHVSN